MATTTRLLLAVARALVALVVFTGAPTSASDDEGFGGAPAPDTRTDRDEGERLRSDTESDDEALAPTSERSTATPAASPQPPASRGARSPFDDALRSVRADRMEGPLPALRAEVSALDDETARAEVAYKNGTLDEKARTVVVERWRARRAILDEVELYALRLRERCMRARGEVALLPELLPRGARLSRDAPGVALLLRTRDTKDCDRRVLVDEAAIARVERLHEIERTIPEMGYRQLAARRALEEERTAILADLMGTHDDKPRALQVTTKRHDGKAAGDALRPQGTLRDLVGDDGKPVTPIR